MDSAQGSRAPRRHHEVRSGPRIIEAIGTAKARLDRFDHGRISRLLSRPRFLRGPSIGIPVDSPTIVTERLHLRPHMLADVDEWYSIVSDPQLVRYLSWSVRDRAEAKRHLRDRTHHTRLWQVDDFLALAVVLGGRLIGDVSLQVRSVSADVRSVEVGWVLATGHHGHGYATEAVSAMLRVAFEQADARMALAVIDEANAPSIALAKRLGFIEIAHRSEKCLFAVAEPSRP
jgi:RimJ/RimL family protein N-acetyltransferase